MSIFQLVSWFRLLFLYLPAYSIARFSPEFNRISLQNRAKTASAARKAAEAGRVSKTRRISVGADDSVGP